MKPNLFHFATSELSNDAIICWMLSWGNIPEAPLHNLSQDLIGHFFGMPSDTLRVNNVEIVRQHKNIDVFAKVNESLLLVIEDKVSALAGWNQLEGYKEAVLTSYQETHSRDNMAFIYLTIEDEGNYKSIKEKGFKVVTRGDLLRILENYKNVDNNILKDYYEHLSEIEAEVNSYTSGDKQHVLEWERRAWHGFYKELQSEYPESSWGPVSNPKGGFQYFAWASHHHHYEGVVGYHIYLQIEENRIAFKVAVKDEEYRSAVRNHVWSQLREILETAERYDYWPQKTRFRTGKWMTIAEIEHLDTKEEIRGAMKIAEQIIENLNNQLA